MKILTKCNNVVTICLMVVGICIIFFYLYIYGYRNEGFYNYDGSNTYMNSPYGYGYNPYGYGSNSYGYGSNSYNYNPYEYNPYVSTGYNYDNDSNSHGSNSYLSNGYNGYFDNSKNSWGYNFDGNQTIWDKKNELENLLDDIKVSQQKKLPVPSIGTYHSCDVLTSYGNNVCNSGITMEHIKCKWNNAVKNSMGGQCETI